MIYRKYGAIELNQDLVSGFLTALKDFASEISKGKGQLKIVDMRLFNLILVFKAGVLVVVAADKNDSREIAQARLEEIVDVFMEKYSEYIGEDNWTGDIRIFQGFETIIDKILKYGKASEVPIRIPILKIYKKDFEKSQKKIAKKGLILQEVDFRSTIEGTQKPEWTSKRLPKQVVSQGMLSEQEYEISHLCDGFHTIEKIAEEVGIPENDIGLIIDELDELGLLKFITIQ